MTPLKSTIRCVSIIFIFAALCIVCRADEPASLTQLIHQLRHYESSIVSMRAEFTVKGTPTKPEDYARIKEVCNLTKKPDDYRYFILSSDVASRGDCNVIWHKKGPYERYDFLYKTGGEVTMAYDGELVRRLEKGHGNTPRGTLEVLEKSAWNKINRIHPMSVMLQYDNVPYSKLISTAKDAVISSANAGTISISFTHPLIPQFRFDCKYDTTGILKERSLFCMLGTEKKYRLYEHHVPIEIKETTLNSGFKAYYPSRTKITYYMGDDSKSRPVPYKQEDYLFTKVEFNPPLEDSLFTLQFPTNALIYDNVTEQGWLPPNSPLPQPPINSHIYLYLAAVGCVCLFSLPIFWFVFRRRKTSSTQLRS